MNSTVALRQSKAIARMFREGINGFEGRLSASVIFHAVLGVHRLGSLMKMELPSRFWHFAQRIFDVSRRTLCRFPKRAVSDLRSTRAMWKRTPLGARGGMRTLPLRPETCFNGQPR